MRTFIKVDVAPGMFSSERTVSFWTGSAKYQLFVDERLLRGNEMPVRIVDETPDDFIVSLPSDTFTSGSTVSVPRKMVELG